ncbi:CHAT domain-containing protein [Streptomyces litchfieldiae]|uniref:CHAT domain-containing protein n=1 Tax=Streptomyces litchfieldiae TaxID=3075543 RepID=A0ABU2MQX3_9ACTN|nr:CHAT domain-containing protein [Streptomyces sp. DSM 44938]MDT0343876.1 CHAT domain-containing protein [Streptomyces sp. DSM 44938]
MTGDGSAGLRGYLEADSEGAASAPAVRPPAAAPPEDAVPPPPARGFEPERAGLTASLPDDVALLCVTASRWEGEPRLTLNWHHRRSVRSASHERISLELPPSDLSLARLVREAGERRDGRAWRDAYYEVMNWWLPETRLMEWIRELLATPGGGRLVVWDNTAHDIAWELLYHQPSLNDPDPTTGWLGELIPVIRWTSVHDGERYRRYSAEEWAGEGGLLMLEDETLDGGRPADAPDSFTPYLVEPRARTVPELMSRLGEPGEPFGLLLIRCHGVYSPETRRFTLGGLSLNEYTDFSMAALRRFRAPVLLNACSSGRTVADARHPGAPVRGFAELFLRRGASAVIATVGDIDLNHSHDFAVRLLLETEAGQTNLAAVLHGHRRHYARLARRRPGEREDSRTEADFKLFFDSFLYVYFGHPDTSLVTVTAAHRSTS